MQREPKGFVPCSTKTKSYIIDHCFALKKNIPRQCDWVPRSGDPRIAPTAAVVPPLESLLLFFNFDKRPKVIVHKGQLSQFGERRSAAKHMRARAVDLRLHTLVNVQ